MANYYTIIALSEPVRLDLGPKTQEQLGRSYWNVTHVVHDRFTTIDTPFESYEAAKDYVMAQIRDDISRERLSILRDAQLAQIKRLVETSEEREKVYLD